MMAWLRRMVREATHYGRDLRVWDLLTVDYLPGRGGRHSTGIWAGDILERVWYEQRQAARARETYRLHRIREATTVEHTALMDRPLVMVG